MDVAVSLATTGDIVYSSKYSEVNELRIWELRLHICHELACSQYFSLTLLHERDLVDDTALVSTFQGDTDEGTIQFHVVLRELRPPTDEERRAIIDCIEMRHRSYLWNIKSKGVQMISTIPAGTARESSLVRAFTARPFPMLDRYHNHVIVSHVRSQQSGSAATISIGSTIFYKATSEAQYFRSKHRHFTA